MKTKIRVHSCLFVVVLFFCSCAITQKLVHRAPPEIPASAPIAEAGKDLHTAVALATHSYIEAKNGDASFAWSIKKGIEAYQLYVETKQDVKVIVQQWSDGTKAGKSFAEKLAALFEASTGTPGQKAEAVAQGVETGALAAKGP